MKQQNISFFNRPLFWIILAFIGFALLPSKALDYGLFESTSDELMDAMGWSSVNLTWLWFAPLAAFPLLSGLFKDNIIARSKA